MTTSTDPVATWANACDHFAPMYTLPRETPPPERWVRFAGADKPPGNRGAGAMLFADGAGVVLRDWTCDYRDTYQSRNGGRADPIERARLAAEHDRRRRERDARATCERLEAVARFERHAAALAPADTAPYIVAKGLGSAHGATADAHGTVHLVGRGECGRAAFGQRIFADGSKRLARGTSFAGAWVTLGDPTGADRLVVATGWATSAVVFEDTGVPVLSTLCDGNLQRVAETARRLWPSATLVIAGDDDRHGRANSGRNAAEAAALATGARVLLPTFCRADCSCSDFADVRACERGTVRL